MNQEIQEKVICEDYERKTTKDKIFYSHESSVILILYWYVGLSSIEGKVTITESECKAVQVNICEMYFRCRRRNFICGRYLTDVSRILGVHFFYAHPLHVRSKTRVEWLVDNKTRCFILHLFNNFNNGYGWHSNECEVEFVAVVASFGYLDFQIRQTIHGLIRNSTLEKYHGDLAPCRYACAHNQYHRTDVVEVRGHLEEFCRSFPTKENMSCFTRAYGNMFSSDEHVENEFILKTKAHMHYSESYSIIIRMDRFQQSWVTMVTHITNLSNVDSKYKIQVN